MSLAKSWTSGGKTGDGLAQVTYLALDLLLPDSGTTLTLQGKIIGVTIPSTTSWVTSLAQLRSLVATTPPSPPPLTALASVALSPGTLAMPAVPGSGSTFWQVECDPFTGVCTITSSAFAYPAAANCASPNQAYPRLVLAQQTLPSTATNPSLVLLTLTDFW